MTLKKAKVGPPGIVLTYNVYSLHRLIYDMGNLETSLKHISLGKKNTGTQQVVSLTVYRENGAWRTLADCSQRRRGLYRLCRHAHHLCL